MKAHLIVIAVCIAASAYVHAQTQSAMNAHASEEFVRADAHLSKVYSALLARLPDAESKRKLEESQRAWVAFRDAQAIFEADQFRGGSIAPLTRSTTKTELTEQRIRQLKSASLP